MSPELRQLILNEASDCASNFMYYDRKDDEDLPRGSIENAISENVVTVEDIISEFRKTILENL